MIQKEERLVYRLVHSLLRPTKCNVFRQYLTPKIDRYPIASARGTVYPPPCLSLCLLHGTAIPSMYLSACAGVCWCVLVCAGVCWCVCASSAKHLPWTAPTQPGHRPAPARGQPGRSQGAGRAQAGRSQGAGARARAVDRRGPWGDGGSALFIHTPCHFAPN